MAFTVPVRNIGDAAVAVTRALNAAAGTVNSASIDLRAVNAGGLGAATRLTLDVPTLSGILTGAHTITYTVQDSADNSSFATLAGIDAKVYTGTDAAAVAKDWRLPPVTRRYLRVSILAGAAAEDCSAVSATFALKE